MGRRNFWRDDALVVVMSPPATKLLVSAAAIAAALAGALLPAGPAAATSPLPPTTPQPSTPALELPASSTAQLVLPADVKYYTELGNIFRFAPLLGGDGTLAWFYSRQRSPDDARALGRVTANPVEPPVYDGLEQPMTLSTVPNSVALRSYETWNGRFSASAPMVDGGTWIADSTFTPRPARTRLVQLDDRGAFVRKLGLPKGTAVSALVPTSRGLRVVGVKDKRVVISGPGVRSWVRDPYLSPNDVVRAAPLPDGSLLVSGSTRSKGQLPQPVLRVSPSGKITRLADRRKPSAATNTASAGLVPTKLGIAMFENGGIDNLPQADVKDALVIRGDRGQVLARKQLSAMPFGAGAWPCRLAGGARRVTGLVAGPDGLPVLRLSCTYYDPQTYNQSRTSLLVGLGEDLAVRWTKQSYGLRTDPYYEPCGSTFVGANAKLWWIDCEGRYLVADAPGYGVAQVGTIVSSKRDGKRGVVVRIRCRGDHGTVCSGAVRVDVGGAEAARVPYLLPARPGKAAATLDRHVPTAAPVTGRFTASLEPRR